MVESYAALRASCQGSWPGFEGAWGERILEAPLNPSTTGNEMLAEKICP